MEAKKNISKKYVEEIILIRNNVLFYLASLLILSIFCYVKLDKIYKIISQPLIERVKIPFLYTSIADLFISNINISILSGFLISLPILFLQIYLFVCKGLRRNERKYLVLISISPILFYLGLITMYYLVLPGTIDFFISSEEKIGVKIQFYPKIIDYIRFIVKIGIGFGISFELPIFMTLFVKSGLINLDTLKNNRRIVLVIFLIFAAIVTPPDIFSQIVLTSIMMGIYEITILFIKSIK